MTDPADEPRSARPSVAGAAVTTRTTRNFAARYGAAPGTRGGGHFALRPGERTDDTATALALADAGGEDRALADPSRVIDGRLDWACGGAGSQTGACFDTGTRTAAVLRAWADHRRLPAPDGRSGTHDRVAAFAGTQRQGDLTHGHSSCHRIAGEFGAIPFDLIDGRIDPAAIGPDAVASRPIDAVRATGQVVDTWEAALWAFAPRDGSTAVVLGAVNLGDDADTVGAVAGQLADTADGLSGMPSARVNVLAGRNRFLPAVGRLIAPAPARFAQGTGRLPRACSAPAAVHRAPPVHAASKRWKARRERGHEPAWGGRSVPRRPLRTRPRSGRGQMGKEAQARRITRLTASIVRCFAASNLA